MENSNLSDNQHNFFTNKTNKDADFFIQDDLQYLFNNTINNNRHLNDYDYNILQEDAYKNLKDELLKIEYKITKIENDIKSIEEQIVIVKDIKDDARLNWLQSRRNKLGAELETLKFLYNQKSVSAKFSNQLTNFVPRNITDKNLKFSNVFGILPECIKKLLPNKILSFFELKTSIQKLEAIHKNVDELMTNQAPYGEIETHYERLSTYISKANNIQSKLYKDFHKK